MSVYKAHYIWLDGQQPTSKMRGKTRVLPIGEEPPIWGFDGSSTEQAVGHASDCVLKPVFVCPDPIRGGESKLVMCGVFNTDMTPHASNTRAKLRAIAEQTEDQEAWFGIEQEYTLFEDARPLGWPKNGFPAPQGGYYCGVGADEVFGREIVEDHLDACISAELAICGINAEVMPAQWEFQIGPVSALTVSDHLWVARWLMYRIAEDYGVTATLHPKPVLGDWNGAGAHTNFSTKGMREGWDPIIAACEALSVRVDYHIENYGDGIPLRLTGEHETCSYNDYRYGVSDRGASVRIPWMVDQAKKGYIEDRRPNANCDPYVVTRVILESVCGVS